MLVLNLVINLGLAKGFLNENRLKIRDGVRKMIFYDAFKGLEFRENHQDAQAIIKKIQEMSSKDREIITSQSKFTGNIYVKNIGDYEGFNADSMSNYIVFYPIELYAYHNLQHPQIYASARYIEKELTKIGVDLFRGSNTVDNICGLISSGGTESIIFAILSFRNKAREKGITEPELYYN